MSNHDTKVLNTLIATTIDSADGYKDAAERASNGQIKEFFSTMAWERRQTAEKLRDQVRQLGGTPEDEGTLKAAAHRRWLDLKDALSHSDGAVLQTVEEGETYIREKYEAALKDKKLSAGARRAISEAFTSVAKGKAQVSDLRRRLGISEAEQGGRSGWSKIGLGVGAAAAVAGVAMAASRRRGSQGGNGGNRETDDEFTPRLQTDEDLRLISSKKVEGTPVIDRDGERLGKIDSFMVDKYTGRVGYAVMTFGGTMGFGQSLFPLPWASLTYDEDEGGYRLPITKDELNQAPRFEASDEPEFSPEYRRQIMIFYRPGTAGGMRGTTGRGTTSAGSRSGGDRTSAQAQQGRWSEADTGGQRMAAGGTDQNTGQSGGSPGSFGSTTGGSFGASSGNDQTKV